MNKIGQTGIILGILMLVFFGCAENRKTAYRIPAGIYPRKLIVLPFSTVKSEEKIVSCPVCGFDNMAGPITPGAKGVLTDLLMSGLRRKGFQIVPMDEVLGEISSIGNEKAWHNIIATSKILSRKFNVPLVVSGVVFAYRSRQGGALGVTKPATVSFGLHLIRGKDGHVMWADRYHETQQALSEDISNLGKFLKRKGTWVTAERLARDGMAILLDHFPRIQ